MLENPLFWLFAAPGLPLGLYAQARIKLNYTKYFQVATASGLTGAEVARQVLDSKRSSPTAELRPTSKDAS